MLCPLPPPHSPSAPSHPLLGLESHGKKQKSQLSPTRASKEGLKEQKPIRTKLCSIWLATERKRSKDSSNRGNLTPIPPSPCQGSCPQADYRGGGWSWLHPSKGSLSILLPRRTFCWRPGAAAGVFLQPSQMWLRKSRFQCAPGGSAAWPSP